MAGMSRAWYSSWEDLYWWLWPWYFFMIMAAAYVQVAMILGTLYVTLYFTLGLTALAIYSPLWIAMRAAGLVEAFQYQYSKPVDLRVLRFGPAVTAIFTAILALVSYFGLGVSGGLSYDCMTTEKKSFYDLLG